MININIEDKIIQESSRRTDYSLDIPEDSPLRKPLYQTNPELCDFVEKLREWRAKSWYSKLLID